jgi:hypothetical protein
MMMAEVGDGVVKGWQVKACGVGWSERGARTSGSREVGLTGKRGVRAGEILHGDLEGLKRQDMRMDMGRPQD